MCPGALLGGDRAARRRADRTCSGRASAQRAGIDPAGYSLAGWPNESLGAASAELMRRLQAARRDDGPNVRHRAKLKHRLAKQTLAEHRKAEPSLVLPPELFDWTVAAHTTDLVAAVRRTGPRVVGDLGELDPAARRSMGRGSRQRPRPDRRRTFCSTRPSSGCSASLDPSPSRPAARATS